MKQLKKCIIFSLLIALAAGIFGFGAVTLKEAMAGEREEVESGDWYYKLLEDGTAELTRYYGEKVNVEIPSEIDGKKVTKLGGYGVFSTCRSLKSVSIPDGVTEIGYGTFNECTYLETVSIPDSVKKIGKRAFYDCTKLKSVGISDGVAEIGGYAFSHCESLEVLNIPDSVKEIGYGAFADSGLKEITGGKGLEKLEDYAFSGTDWIRNQNKVKKDGEWYCSFGDMQTKCRNWTDFAEKIEFEPKGADWNDYTRAYVELPDGTVMLWSGEVYDLSPIDGKKISYISDWAFGDFESWRAELTEEDIVMPEGIEYIGKRIGGFSEGQINSIIFPSTLKCIEDLAYTGNSMDENLYKGSITSVRLNDGLVKIGKGAFWAQKLKSVTIPSSVKEIGEFAFGYEGPGPTGPSDNQFDAVSELFVKIPDFTIYGYPNTAAEAYAKENGFAFIALTDTKEPSDNPEAKPTDSAVTLSASGEFSPKLETTKDGALFAVAKYLAEGQLEAVKNGNTPLEIRLAVNGIDKEISNADKELIDKAVAQYPDSEKLNFKILNYLDISLCAVIDGKELPIHETEGALTVSLELEKPANEGYKIVRLHDGVAELLDARLSGDGTRLIFETDKFSTYAIVYSDIASGGSAPIKLVTVFMLAVLTVLAAGGAIASRKFKTMD
ncbi:MAG: leucine-rich repeat domain-containing protein [Butyrivibrio sp.]|nr:leucine-rich repeat domain-containing protein [Butyrivibrio sp.]